MCVCVRVCVCVSRKLCKFWVKLKMIFLLKLQFIRFRIAFELFEVVIEAFFRAFKYIYGYSLLSYATDVQKFTLRRM